MRTRLPWTVFIAVSLAACSSRGGSSGSGSLSPASTAAPQSGSGGQSSPLPGTPPAPPQLSVSGGIVAQKAVQPLVFTWQSTLTVTGDGFRSAEAVDVFLFGPTNSLGVGPSSLRIGGAAADASGHFSAAVAVPYDGGTSGPNTLIPRPGAYLVKASSQQAGTVAAKDTICLAPETNSKIIDWGHERGSRLGNLPGSWASMSPERTDPEWISVWDEKPVGVYGSAEGVVRAVARCARLSAWPFRVADPCARHREPRT